MTITEIARTHREQPSDARDSRSLATGWPINEIMLESLESRGLSEVEIARRFQVTWRQVQVLREQIR